MVHKPELNTRKKFLISFCFLQIDLIYSLRSFFFNKKIFETKFSPALYFSNNISNIIKTLNLYIKLKYAHMCLYEHEIFFETFTVENSRF
jgi:hypothetical protein